MVYNPTGVVTLGFTITTGMIETSAEYVSGLNTALAQFSPSLRTLPQWIETNDGWLLSAHLQLDEVSAVDGLARVVDGELQTRGQVAFVEVEDTPSALVGNLEQLVQNFRTRYGVSIEYGDREGSADLYFENVPFKLVFPFLRARATYLEWAQWQVEPPSNVVSLF